MARLIALVLLFCYGLSTASDEPQHGFVINSATTQVSDKYVYLNALMDISLPEYVSYAFEQGFELPLLMRVEIVKPRSYWFNKRITSIEQGYRLQYHVLLDTVALYDIKKGEYLYFQTLEDALNHLAVVYNYPLLETRLLEKSTTYRARMKFGIDTSQLPIPMKSSAWWVDNWDLESNWFEWEFKR